jgi:hypothetical protein
LQQQTAAFPQSSRLVNSPSIRVSLEAGIDLTILSAWKSRRVTEKDINPSTSIDRIVEQTGSYEPAAPASELPQTVRRHRSASDSQVLGIKIMFDKSLIAIIFTLILTIRVPAVGIADPIQTPKSPDTRIEKVKAKVNKIVGRENITVFRIDGKNTMVSSCASAIVILKSPKATAKPITPFNIVK